MKSNDNRSQGEAYEVLDRLEAKIKVQTERGQS